MIGREYKSTATPFSLQELSNEVMYDFFSQGALKLPEDTNLSFRICLIKVDFLDILSLDSGIFDVL